jgi:hypothetical protein
MRRTASASGKLIGAVSLDAVGQGLPHDVRGHAVNQQISNRVISISTPGIERL